MVHASAPPQTSRDRSCAEARVGCLLHDPVDPGRGAQTDPRLVVALPPVERGLDHIDQTYLHEPDLETRLARSADPVLRHLYEQLDGQPISIIPTDAGSLVHGPADRRSRPGTRPRWRHAGPRLRLRRGPRRHQLHRHRTGGGRPGACVRGTKLPRRAPSSSSAARSVPIHDPTSGKTVGVIDLTCWRKDADPLMLSLVKATADLITQALVSASTSRTSTCSRSTCGPAAGPAASCWRSATTAVMLNDHARRLLDPGDQAALIGHATEALVRSTTGAVTVDLPSGAVARVSCSLDRPPGPLRRRRGPRQAHLAGRGCGRRAGPARGHVPTRPGRQRGPVAARVPRGGGAVRELGVDDAGGRARRRQAGPGPGGPPAQEPGRAVPRARRRGRQPGVAHRDPP